MGADDDADRAVLKTEYKRSLRKAGGVLAMLAAGLPLVHAQTAIVELDPLEVRTTSDGAGALGAAGFGHGTVMGVDGNRTTWQMDAADLAQAGIGSVENLVGALPGASAPARFGVVTVPNMRGDAAELFFNGQRRGDNLFGIAPSFTIVERIEVVAGAPLLRAGPGKRTGGAMDLRTRKAEARDDFGELTLRLGSWLPTEDSYGTVELTVDHNQPLAAGRAIRMVASVRDDDTFYRRNGGRNDNRDLYFTFTQPLGDDGNLQAILYYQSVERPQTLGVNRPWQGLIDDGLYVVGGVASGGAEPGLIDAGPRDLVDLDRDRVLMSTGDRGSGEAWLAQMQLDKPMGAGHFSHSVMIERVRRDKLHGFYYAEDVSQLTIDSMSRLAWGAESGAEGWRFESGFQARLENRSNLTNYWNEFAYAFDISAGRRFDAYAEFPESIAIGAVVDREGLRWYLPSSIWGTPESNDSRILQIGADVAANWRHANGWSLALGARLDRFALRAREQADLVAGVPWEDRATDWMASGALSVSKQHDRGLVYATVSQMRGIAGNTVGDGLNLYPPGELWAQDYRNRSRLIEAGGQFAITRALQLDAVAFQQDRTRREFFGNYSIRARGGSIGLQAQLDRRTALELRVDYLDARYRDAAPAEFGGGSLWNVYAPGAGPESAGLGFGYLGGFFLNSIPAGNHRLPGVSDWQLRLAMSHQFSDSLSLRIWGDWQSEQSGNLAGEYHIPDQFELSLSLLFERPGWSIQLIARNLLDAENWRHNGDTFFNQMLVSRDLPLRVEAILRWRY